VPLEVNALKLLLLFVFGATLFLFYNLMDAVTVFIWEAAGSIHLLLLLLLCFLASSLMPYLAQVRLMVGLLKSVGTGDLTTADGMVLCSSSSTSLNTFFAS
jgi:hypothetical protein